jgi:hypothetical protein
MEQPDRFFIVEALEDQPEEIWIEGEVLAAYISPEEVAALREYGSDPAEVARRTTANSLRGELMTLKELLDTAGGERALAEWRAGAHSRRDSALHGRYIAETAVSLTLVRGEDLADDFVP